MVHFRSIHRVKIYTLLPVFSVHRPFLMQVEHCLTLLASYLLNEICIIFTKLLVQIEIMEEIAFERTFKEHLFAALLLQMSAPYLSRMPTIYKLIRFS